jgi:DNA-binding CsgD family transcriptional regulator
VENLRRLAGLSHQGLRDVAALKEKGHTDEEIAEQLQCTQRSVQRKLTLIRREWGGAAL